MTVHVREVWLVVLARAVWRSRAAYLAGRRYFKPFMWANFTHEPNDSPLRNFKGGKPIPPLLTGWEGSAKVAKVFLVPFSRLNWR